MDITVYLPDEIGERAKAAELNLSRLLRNAVTDELERRTSMTKTLEEPETYLLPLEHSDGYAYEGRITGRRIAQDPRTDLEVYLTDDRRIIVYDGGKLQFWQVNSDDLRGWIDDDDVYAEAMSAIGETPIIDL